MAAGRLLPALDHTLRVEATSPLADPSSKFHVWGEASRVVRAHPVFGAGRGAFEQAYTQVAERGAALRVRWVENGYIQAAVDWGLPVALLLVVLAGASLFLAVRRLAPDPVSAGALGGVVGLAIHDFADFASELPGVALPALALLACLYSRQKSGVEPGMVRARVARAAYLVPLLLVVPIVATLFSPLAEADARRLTRLVRDPAVPVATVLEAGRAAQRRHPADYFLHLVVAERLVHERHPESLRWLNDAIALNPTHPAPHLMAAELLAATGRMSQALLEYRAALTLSATPQIVWERLGARTTNLEELLAAAPPDAAALTELGAYLLGRNRTADAEAAYLRAHALAPEAARPLRQLTYIATLRGDRAAARDRAAALLAVARDTDARFVAARAYIAVGDLALAGTTVDLVDEHSPAAFAIGLELARALAAAGDFEPARARLDRLGGYGEKLQRITLHQTRAEIEAKAGNEHQAEWERQQAEELKGGK
jgi:Flp pilus assembly protein TadD